MARTACTARQQRTGQDGHEQSARPGYLGSRPTTAVSAAISMHAFDGNVDRRPRSLTTPHSAAKGAIGRRPDQRAAQHADQVERLAARRREEETRRQNMAATIPMIDGPRDGSRGRFAGARKTRQDRQVDVDRGVRPGRTQIRECRWPASRTPGSDRTWLVSAGFQPPCRDKPKMASPRPAGAAPDRSAGAGSRRPVLSISAEAVVMLIPSRQPSRSPPAGERRLCAGRVPGPDAIEPADDDPAPPRRRSPAPG